MSPPRIRAATEADASSIAKLHVEAWQWAYRGQLPDTFLDQLTATIPQREARRRRTLAQPTSDARTWVAELDGALVGFADSNPARDSDLPPETAELSTLYLKPEVVGSGVGRALMQQALADLRQRGFRSAVLWVLDSNARARRFYEVGGWRRDGGVKVEHQSDVTLREVRYRIDLAAGDESGQQA